MNSLRKVLVVAVTLAVVVITAPQALAAISVARAELSGTRLRVEGQGAVANASISVDGTVMGRADGAGVFRIERDPFTSSTCTITVSDGSTSTQATLSGCSTSPDPGDQTGTVQIVRGGAGHGRITSQPPGIDCTIAPDTPPGTCSARFAAGTEVRLNPQALPGSEFRGWALTSSCRDAPKVEVLANNLHSCQPVFFLDN